MTFKLARRTRASLVLAAAALPLTLAHTASAYGAGSLCSDWAGAVAVDGWYRTWVGGTAADNRILEWETGHAHFGDFAVARLTRAGQPDETFGDSASTIIDAGDFDSITDIAPHWNGAIVAGTTAQRVGDRIGPTDAVVFRLNNDGELVNTFGDGGLVQLDLGGSESVATVLTGSREIYLAGTIQKEGGDEAFVARLDRRGKLDDSFGTQGMVLLGSIAGMEHAFAMRRLSDGFVVGGHGAVKGESHAMAAKLTAQGHLDNRFGVNGVASFPVGANTGQGTAFFSNSGATAVSLPIVTAAGDTQVAVVLFSKKGQVLPAVDGPPFLIDAPTGTLDFPNAGAFSWSSTLYIVGATYPDDFTTGDAFIVRTSRDGVTDPRFGDGVVTEHFDLEYAAFNDLASNFASLTAAGWNFSEGDATLPLADALIVRYHHDGTLDEAFGDKGIVLLDFMKGEAVCGPRIVVE